MIAVSGNLFADQTQQVAMNSSTLETLVLWKYNQLNGIVAALVDNHINHIVCTEVFDEAVLGLFQVNGISVCHAVPRPAYAIATRTLGAPSLSSATDNGDLRQASKSHIV